MAPYPATYPENLLWGYKTTGKVTSPGDQQTVIYSIAMIAVSGQSTGNYTALRGTQKGKVTGKTRGYLGVGGRDCTGNSTALQGTQKAEFTGKTRAYTRGWGP